MVCMEWSDSVLCRVAMLVNCGVKAGSTAKVPIVTLKWWKLLARVWCYSLSLSGHIPPVVADPMGHSWFDFVNLSDRCYEVCKNVLKILTCVALWHQWLQRQALTSRDRYYTSRTQVSQLLGKCPSHLRYVQTLWVHTEVQLLGLTHGNS